MHVRHALEKSVLSFGPALILAWAAIGLAVAPAMAADGDSTATPPAAERSGAPFSDTQLKAFVKAQSRVQATLGQWGKKIDAADDPARIKQLKKQQNEALVKAVKDSGLKPETYNAIAKTAQDDPALTRRIQSYMQPR